MAQVTLIVEISDLMADVMVAGLDESETVTIIPDQHFPGYVANIVSAMKES